MNDKLNEIYEVCTCIIIKPHNANTRDKVTIDADLSIKHQKSSNFQYSKLHFDAPTLNEALDKFHHMAMGYKKLVEEMP